MLSDYLSSGYQATDHPKCHLANQSARPSRGHPIDSSTTEEVVLYLKGYTQGEQSDEVEIKEFLKKMVLLAH
jgi:hypothetical protein